METNNDEREGKIVAKSKRRKEPAESDDIIVNAI
jgi:hypothetical protein